MLVDARHGLKDVDMDMMKLLNAAAVPYRVVLTKCDKANQAEVQKTITAIEGVLKKNPAAFPHPHLTSSDKKIGIDELRDIILSAVQ